MIFDPGWLWQGPEPSLDHPVPHDACGPSGVGPEHSPLRGPGRTLACRSSLAAFFFSLPVEWRTAAAAGLVSRVRRSADLIPLRSRPLVSARCSVVRQYSCLHFAGPCAKSACPLSFNRELVRV